MDKRPDHNNTVEIHPEDREMVVEGRKYAEAHGAAFCEKYRTEIDRLITEYGDGMAEMELMDLRERFWTDAWRTPAPVKAS